MCDGGLVVEAGAVVLGVEQSQAASGARAGVVMQEGPSHEKKVMEEQEATAAIKDVDLRVGIHTGCRTQPDTRTCIRPLRRQLALTAAMPTAPSVAPLAAQPPTSTRRAPPQGMLVTATAPAPAL